MAKIARSASFERRRKKKPPTAREGTTSEESSGESSPTSRCVSPDLEESDEPLSKELAGWLLKRHTREKNLGSQWARRYFHVNEIRGTLSMSKGPRKKASAAE